MRFKVLYLSTPLIQASLRDSDSDSLDTIPSLEYAVVATPTESLQSDDWSSEERDDINPRRAKKPRRPEGLNL